MTAAPIDEKTLRIMQGLAAGIDDVLNGPAPAVGRRDRRIGFVLLVAEFGVIEGGRVNYVSNGDRADMVAMLREYLARLEGRYVETPEGRQ